MGAALSAGSAGAGAGALPRFDAPPIASLAAPGVERAGINSMAQGDFDGDGVPDFASAAFGGAAPGASLATGVAVYRGRGDGTFAAPVEYPAGPYPIQVIAGRLRGPGTPLDLVVADAGGDHPLSVLLGNGDGTFQPPRTVPLPAAPASLAAGDFDGDGKLDVAVGSNSGLLSGSGVPKSLIVLLGNGDGSFQAPRQYEGGTGLSVYYETDAADLTQDGRLDIMGMDPQGLWLSVGNGDGSFRPGVLVWEDPTTYVGGQMLGGPSSFAIGDFNRDGRRDVALDVNGARLDLLLGTGAGVFVPAGEYDVTEDQTGFGGGSIETADVGGDGNLDLVVATGWGATLAVLRGNGDGTFQAPIVHPLPEYNDESFVIADADRDGDPDIVAGTNLGGLSGSVNYLTALLNRGDGTFPAPRQYPVVAAWDKQNVNPVGVALARLDGDSNLDLAVTEFDFPLEPAAHGELPALPKVDLTTRRVDTGGTVAVLLGRGDGSFGEETQYGVGGRPIAVAARDLSGDGAQDLVVANIFSNTLSLLKGNGDGTFRPAVTVPVGRGPNALAPGDFDADGRPDVAVTNLSDNDVSVLLNHSAGGDLDLAAPVDYPVGTGPNALAAGDLNGDGRVDLAAAGYGDPFVVGSPSTLTVLLGDGAGAFRPLPSQTLWTTRGADALGVGDLDGDGRLDLAAANFDLGRVQVLRGLGDGTFAAAGEYRVGAGPESIAVADYNGDGAPDLAVDDLNDDTIALLLGKGDGTFVPAADPTSAQPSPFGWPAFAYPTFLAVGDLTGDAKPDLVTANLFDGVVTVLRNTTPSPPPVPTCYEDDDPRVAYDSGWHTIQDQNASAGHFRLLSAKGGQHGLTFGFGTQTGQGTLTYFFATSTKGGGADLYLDGQLVRTATYRGGTGSLHQPVFGASAEVGVSGAGTHTFELRNASGAAYVDKLCVTDGTARAQATGGPGATTTSSGTLGIGQQLAGKLAVPSDAEALAVVAEAAGAIPFQLVVLDPRGEVAARADSSQGIASVQTPVSAAGTYVVQLVNVGLGPVEVWSAATPQLGR